MHTSASPSRIKLPGFFVFWWSYTDTYGVLRDCAICFKAPGAVQPSAWIDLIEEVSKGPEIPDAVIFLYLDSDKKNYLVGKNDETVVTYLNRFDGRALYFEMLYKVDSGNFIINKILKPLNNSIKIEWNKRIKNQMPLIFQAGLDRIFTAEEVVIEAPPGFQFMKHSGGKLKKSRCFLRAEQGLTDSSVVSFVALCVWHRILKSMPLKDLSDIESIYIDTMGIAPVAFALREIFNQNRMKNLPQIESFHSYGGIDNITILKDTLQKSG